MSETTNQNLSGVAESSLAPLYIRAMETQRPDALIKDEKAVELVRRISYDFGRIRQVPGSEAYNTARVLIGRELDHYAQDFLRRHPDGVVVHIGCGLDSRFERVDNGHVEWYDLDLPDVIELRRKFIGDEAERYHLLDCSVFEGAWLETVEAHRPRPFLFLAEVVFEYFEEEQVKSLVLTLRDHFPGAELVFDACSPFDLWVGNLYYSRSKLSARFRWGISNGQEIERWGDGIRLLDEWGWLDQPEPRLARLRWLRNIPFFAKMVRIYHFQLGKAAG
jgi:O-methyltransferase involved in polyketide biosynthesis